ncbi:hypothetical protein [Roseococcus pinisoli]|uniref:Uncharacterized protein n=1 Tax=Roseococcus pinisoli TaxID=2835040 RepID=A0ABS5QF53_9PROT|nr:hypothetical protein [Roseococcus pinisoli]MBS7812301.1 hypothetical protein [Roseococcus pinisoli]
MIALGQGFLALTALLSVVSVYAQIKTGRSDVSVAFWMLALLSLIGAGIITLKVTLT